MQSPQPQQSQQSKSSGKNSAKANRSGRGQRREPKYQRNENLAAEIFSMNYAHEEELYGRGSGTSGYSSQRNGSGSRNRGGNRSNKARFRSYSISKSEYVQAKYGSIRCCVHDYRVYRTMPSSLITF